jgi:DNA-binding NtrC family response regulator
LRRRKQDLVPLAKQFVAKFAQTPPVPIEDVDNDFYRAIQAHDWPGNIRELENAVRRAIILCRKGRLTPEGLPSNVMDSFRATRNNPAGQDGLEDASATTLDHFVSLTERDVIESALRQNKYNRTATARSLGISRVTLYNKMRKYRMLTPQVQLYRA